MASVVLAHLFKLVLEGYSGQKIVYKRSYTRSCFKLYVDIWWVEDGGIGVGRGADDAAVQQAKQHGSLGDAASAAATVDVDRKDQEKLVTGKHQWFVGMLHSEEYKMHCSVCVWSVGRLVGGWVGRSVGQSVGGSVSK